MLKWVVKSEANLAERVPANDCPLSNNFDVIFYCSVGERSGALTLLNAASDLTGILQTDDQGFSLPEIKAHGSFFIACCQLSVLPNFNMFIVFTRIIEPISTKLDTKQP